MATRGPRSRATPGSASGRLRVPRGEAVVHHQADGLAEPALVRGIGARPDLPSDSAMCPHRGAPASQASTKAWTRSLGLSLKGEPGSLLRQRHDDAGSNIGGYSCTRWCRGAQDRSDQSGVSMAPDSMRATASVAGHGCRSRSAGRGPGSANGSGLAQQPGAAAHRIQDCRYRGARGPVEFHR